MFFAICDLFFKRNYILKKVVTIGGGNGLSNLLEGLVRVDDFDITAIVTVMDSGGSTGILRQENQVIAFGDIRRALAALCPFKSKSTSEVFEDLTSEVDLERLRKNFNYRYKSGENKGHAAGNLFLLNLTKKLGSEKKAINEAHKILKIKGKVLPVTLDNVDLVAELSNDEKIIGEENIDTAKKKLSIKRIYLEPEAKINTEVKNEIQKADIIIIGPGDLYTSVFCNFVVDGLKQAIKKSKAKKIWVNNLTNKLSETSGFRLSDYLDQIDKYVGKNIIDYVLYQNKFVGKDPIKIDKENIDFPEKIIGDDFAKKKGKEFVHNSEKVMKIIKKLIANS